VGLVYDGPMDLLLDLIRRQNIDIYDIPMAKITAQFLEYTHHLKQVDVDAAGVFGPVLNRPGVDSKAGVLDIERAVGGEVILIDLVPGRSTTSMVARSGGRT